MSQEMSAQQSLGRMLLTPTGENTVITGVPGAKLVLSFNLDTTTAERAENDLIFSFEDGNTLTVTDFFVTNGEELPPMELADGSELSSADVLASLNPDMNLVTAAGPNASGADGGGTSYADDSGGLVDGVGRLGANDNGLFWDRDTSREPLFTSTADGALIMPSASVDIDIATTLNDPSLSGDFSNTLFEDGQAFQHMNGHKEPADADYGSSVTPGELNISITPNGPTVIDSVVLSGFPAGTKLVLSSGVELSPDGGTGGTYTLSYAQTLDSITVIPPVDSSDADYEVSWTVTMSSPGYTGVTQSGSFTVFVDAVADKPEIELGDVDAFTADTQDGSSSEKKGGVGDEVVFGGEVTQIRIPVTTTFTDMDGSETHYIKLSGIPTDWTVDGASLDALGLKVAEAPAGWVPFTNAEGTTTVLLEIVDSSLYNNGQDIPFNTGDWTSSRLDNGKENTLGSAEITSSAIAWETNPSDTVLDNNFAESDKATYLVTIKEDTPEVELLSLTSDESFGRQTVDETGWPHNIAKNAALAITTKTPLSIASGKVEYNLFSDGSNDPYPAQSSMLGVGFEVDQPGQDSGWSTTSGGKIYLYTEDGNIIGRVGDETGDIAFVVTVTNAGLANGENSADVTFSQYMSLQHPDLADGNEPMRGNLSLKLVITDDEGDNTTASVSINVHDDAPCISCLSQDSTVVLSETDLPAGSDPHHIRNDVVPNLHDESKLVGLLSFSYGVDGKSDPNATHTSDTPPFAWTVPSDLLVAFIDGQEGDVKWEVSEDGLTLTGFTTINGTLYPVVEVIAELTEFGAQYTVDLQAALKHSQSQEHSALGEHGHINWSEPDFLDIGIGFTITDGDGDSTSGNLTLQVRDDLPCAGHCTIGDTVLEASLRPGLGGTITSNGGLYVKFGADGAHQSRAVAWDENSLDGEDVKVIIDGKAYDTEVEVSPDGLTLEVFAMDNGSRVSADSSITLTIVDDGQGGYTYEYTQIHAIQHSNKAEIENMVKGLPFNYVVTDADGDTASNTLKINVFDSALLPSVNVAFVDESDAVHGVVSKIMDLNLDAFAPDGMDPKWDEGCLKMLQDIRVSGSDDSLTFSISANEQGNAGKVLTITDATGQPVLTLTLFVKSDGNWALNYEQTQALEHPFGSFLPGPLGHNDALLLGLNIIGSDAEGNSVDNPLIITVLDDGPSIPYGTMTGAIENIQYIPLVFGIIEQIGQLKGAQPWEIGKIGLKIVSSIADLASQAGPDVFASTLSLVDLVFGSRYGELAEIFSGGLGSIIKNISQIVDIVSDPYPANNAFAEGVDKHFDGDLTVDFGFDGAHNEQAVVFSNKGLGLVLNLFGIHKTGAGNHSLNTVRDHSDLEGYSIKGGKVLDAVKAYNGREENGDLVLTFLTIENNDGTYGYRVITNGPLAHDPSILDSLLGRLMSPETIGTIGDTLDTLLNDLLGLGLPIDQLTQTVKDFVAMGPSLGGDSLMLIPLPIVAQDADGDKTLGLGTVVIRDSVPELGSGHELTLKVDEANLSDGTNPDEPVTASGIITVNAAFDGIGGIMVNGEPIVLGGAAVKTAFGEVTFTGITPDVDEAGPWKIEYTYTLTTNVEHEDGNGQNTTLADGSSESFEVQVIDGDGDSTDKLTVTVTIVDDVPIATSDFDTIEASSGQSGLWVAEGNILTGEGTFKDATHSAGAEADAFGADGRGGLSVTGNDGSAHSVDSAANETSIEGKYGTLYIKSNGEYRYELTASLPPGQVGKPEEYREEFAYTITDGDGDESNATLSIDLSGAIPIGPGVIVKDGELKVDESYLSSGSQGGDGPLTDDSTSETHILITSQTTDFLNEITVSGQPVALIGDGNGPWSGVADTTHGKVTLTVTGDGAGKYTLSYSYTLTSPHTGEGDNGRDEVSSADNFSIGVSGNESKVSVTIVDDVPFITSVDDASKALIDQLSGSQEATTGSILFTYGADGSANSGTGNGFSWDAENLNTQTSYQTWDDAGKPTDLLWEVSQDGMTLTGFGPKGEAVVEVKATEKDGKDGVDYTVTLHGALVHDKTTQDEKLPLNLPFTVQDKDGDSVSGETTVTVQDTTPVMSDLAPPTVQGGGLLEPGSQATGSFVLDGKADGIDLSTFTVTVGGKEYSLGEGDIVNLEGNAGSLQFTFVQDPNGILQGEYTYTAGKEVGRLECTFSVKDRDGDVTSENVDITVTAKPGLFIGTNDGEELAGGLGNDVIISDLGGTDFITTGVTKINLAVVVDVSGSMQSMSEDVSKALSALCGQVKDYLESDGDPTVNLALIGMGGHATVSFNAGEITQENPYATLTGSEGNELSLRMPESSGGTWYYSLEGELLSGAPNPGWLSSVKYYEVTATGVTHVTRTDVFFQISDSFTKSPIGYLLETKTDLSDGLINAIDSLRPQAGQGTNYEAGLGAANKWFDDLGNEVEGAVNQTFFITDGEPTFHYVDRFVVREGQKDISLDVPENYTFGELVYWDQQGNISDTLSKNGYRLNSNGVLQSINNGGNSSTVKSKAYIEYPLGKGEFVEVSTNGNVLAGKGSDTSNWDISEGIQEINSLDGRGVTVRAIGLGKITHDDLKLFDSNGKPLLVPDANKLPDLLEEFWQQVEDIAKPIGADTVNGGDGDDIIFGDALNADFLLTDEYDVTQWNNGTTPFKNGDSLAIVKAYLAYEYEVDIDGITNAMVMDFVLEHHDKLGMSDSVTIDDAARGGNDILYGGAGDDTIYGQGGDDVIYGGTGKDTLYGGTGKDVFAWNYKDMDKGRDTVKDFRHGEDALYFAGLFVSLEELTQTFKEGVWDPISETFTATHGTSATITWQAAGEGSLVTVAFVDGTSQEIMLEGASPDVSSANPENIIKDWLGKVFTANEPAGLDALVEDSTEAPPVHLLIGDGESLILSSEQGTQITCDEQACPCQGGDNGILYASVGDESLQGAEGPHIFAWDIDALDGGLDTIMNFQLGSDQLLFEGLFNSIADIQEALANGGLVIHDVDSEGLTLILNERVGEDIVIKQAVEVNLDSHGFSNYQIEVFNGDNLAEQAMLMENILIALTSS